MQTSKDEQWLEGVIKKAEEKMKAVRERSKEKIPYTTVHHVHDSYNDSEKEHRMHEGLNWWTNGFWGGIMWLMYHETKDPKYAETANYVEQVLDACFDEYEGLHHDVGFMWLPTAVANYRISKDLTSRRRGLHAANLLAGRFNPIGKFIRAWNDIEGQDARGWAIIDCMMNIPLLYWASEETKDPRFRQIAELHAQTVSDHFIRPDGSVEHIVEFDPDTGEKVRIHGGQGYKDGSSWTRGQAWALYGFVISYIHTGKANYLFTAKNTAHYFIANIPESGMVPVDFRQPEMPQLEDTSAAAIAACGLIELAKYVDESERKLYLNAAVKLIKNLEANRCDWDPSHDDILQKCTEAYHSDGHHINIIYGDYFFLEALFKLKGRDLFLW